MKLKFTLLLALFLSAGSIRLAAQTEGKALKKAETHLEYEEYKQAIPYLKEAVGYNANNAMSQFLLGKCLFINHEKKMALPPLEAAAKLNPSVDPELHYYLAKCLHYTHRFDEAAAAYKKAQASLRSDDPRYNEIKIAILHCDYAKKAISNPVNARVVNVGPVINTQHSEHSPVISADESVMIFTSVRPGNVGCEKGVECVDEDVYICNKSGDSWTNPAPIKAVNTKAYDATIGLSPDAQTLFIYRDPPGNGDIFFSQLKGTEFQAPQSIGSPVNSKTWEETVSISPDNQILFFTSEREGGLGGSDIYMSRRDEKGNWGEPKNLGTMINTLGEERSPFIHPDGKTLYYSSNSRPDGIGGFDIYKSEMKPDGSFTMPVNMGYPINTADDDIYFVLSASGLHGYYASAKEGGYGEKDIYRIEILPPPPPPKDTVKDTLVVVKAPEPPPVSLTLLKGTVTDAITGAPVEASIKVIDNEKNLVIAEFKSNSATGKYLISLPSGKNYGIQVNATDYLFHSENFDIPAATGYQEITKDVSLKKIKIGATIVLKNIFYDYDKATLRPESKTELERLHTLLIEMPTLVIEIGGHTDSDGSDEYNRKLSDARAKSVVDYLLAKGIAPDRLSSRGYGEAVPVDTNDTPEGKQNNRRTEFKILKF